jgi:hypothetical protein
MKNFIPLGLAVVVGMALSGCGERRVPVEGEVTLDGQPVARATVTFTSEDGSKVFSGQTDENGKFTLSGTAGAGAAPGSYKVTVVKYASAVAAPINPVEEGDPSKMSKDYVSQMKKYADMKKGGGAGPMPPMPGKAGGGASAAKSELPEVYARLETTPLRVTIPSSGPIKLELQKSAR